MTLRVLVFILKFIVSSPNDWRSYTSAPFLRLLWDVIPGQQGHIWFQRQQREELSWNFLVLYSFSWHSVWRTVARGIRLSQHVWHLTTAVTSQSFAYWVYSLLLPFSIETHSCSESIRKYRNHSQSSPSSSHCHSHFLPLFVFCLNECVCLSPFFSISF